MESTNAGSTVNKHFTAVISLVFILTGCGSAGDSGPADGTSTQVSTTSAEVNEVIAEAGKLVPLGPDKDEITDEFTENSPDGTFEYTYETHDVVDNIESVLYLGLNDDIIWPGSMISGDKAHEFVYDPITAPRAPITLSVSLETSVTGDSITQVVNDPKLSTVRQGISDLLKSAIVADTFVPAKVDFFYEEVFSQSQMSLFLETEVSYGAGSLDTAFDFETNTESTKIVAKYQQVYYTIDMDTPSDAAAFFPPNTDPNALRVAIPVGSNPMYVAGVSYGLMAIMTIESNFSSEEMSLALNAAYDSGVVDGQLGFGRTAKEVLEASSIRIVVYGGSTQGLSDIELGYTGFMKIIEASTEFTAKSPGVPLAYKFRHVSDNTLALVTLTSQYTLVRPLRLKQKVRVTLDRFTIHRADDEGSNNEIELDRLQATVAGFVTVPGPGRVTIDGIDTEYAYNFSSGGNGYVRSTGSTVEVGGVNYVEKTFDTQLSFDTAELELWAWARDYDDPGFPVYNDNDNATGTLVVPQSVWLDGGGKHSVWLIHNDFDISADFTITLID